MLIDLYIGDHSEIVKVVSKFLDREWRMIIIHESGKPYLYKSELKRTEEEAEEDCKLLNDAYFLIQANKINNKLQSQEDHLTEGL